MIIETVKISDSSYGHCAMRERTGKRLSVRPDKVQDYPEIDGLIRNQCGHKPVMWTDDNDKTVVGIAL